MESGCSPCVAEYGDRQPDTLYSWRGRPLARHGDDLHLPDGRWWGRILPGASSVFDARGVYLADLLDSDRIATDIWKQGIAAERFKDGWDEIVRPADGEPYDPPLPRGADLGPPPDLFREPLFPPPRAPRP
jgi:hypothetical protein